MRVISGSARGLKLKAPEGLNTRPTTDRIKESLFNILAPDLYDCRFLDLFSGSGGIGIEALSRGASLAVMVEADSKAVKIIKDNVSSARVGERARVLSCDVVTALKKLGSEKAQFDIIFMDSPYNKGFVKNVLEHIVKENLLSDDGYIVAEQSQEDESPNVEGLNVFRVKDYKITKMTFIEKNNSMEV